MHTRVSTYEKVASSMDLELAQDPELAHTVHVLEAGEDDLEAAHCPFAGHATDVLVLVFVVDLTAGRTCRLGAALRSRWVT